MPYHYSALVIMHLGVFQLLPTEYIRGITEFYFNFLSEAMCNATTLAGTPEPFFFACIHTFIFTLSI